MASRNKNKRMSTKPLKSWIDQDSESESSESYDSTSSSSENDDINHSSINSFPISPQLCNERAKDPSPVALLDMLAEVASATLKNEPVIVPHPLTKPPVVKKSPTIVPPTRKPTSQSDLLNLDQIRMLSDKLLLNMFSDMTADELRRTYKYTCYLTPDKCQQTYSSFGNENRARMQMKSHLLGHIAELLAEANTPGRSQRVKFTAEPLPARKKRLAEQNGVKKKFFRKSAKTGKCKNSSQPNNASKSKLSSMCTRSKTKVESDSNKFAVYSSSKGKEELHLSKSGKYNAKRKVSKVTSLNNNHLKCKKDELKESVKIIRKSSLRILRTKSHPKNPIESKDSVQALSLSTVPSLSLHKEVNHRTVEKRDSVPDTLENKKRQKTNVSNKSVKNGQVSDCSIEKEMASDHPQHDHNYTWPTGKKKGIENFDFSSMSDEEFKEIDVVTYPLPVVEESKSGHEDSSCSFIPTGTIPSPAAQIYSIPSSDPNVGHTVEVESDSSNMTAVKTECTCCHKQKRIRRINKVVVPEEFESDSSEFSEAEENNFQEMEVDLPSKTHVLKSKQKKKPEKGTPEWERKLALKCIRMLRSKRKDERVELICKICKNKTFTAQATLMYHYRSHAGIKPFVCTICNTTFTRQHSLNYHMLIHNNKSRFTCMECGRKFRHPSHFKEHMRRHTGETPFECTDCGLRFKTRNTYKRHLKTRHGKLLTANGIMLLSSEEFSKVKTNPRKKAGRRKDKETQWPEISNGALSKATETETKLLDG